MRALVIGVAFAVFASSPALAQRNHAVKGYVTKNGTYVAPTRATNPNRSKADNYSSKPNVNPYSGRAGTRNPYAPRTPRR